MKVINKISDDLIEIIEYAKPNACFQTNEYPDNYDFVVLKEIINPFDLYNDNKVKDKEIERLKKCKNEVLEYLDISNMSFIDKNEIAIRLKGSDKE